MADQFDERFTNKRTLEIYESSSTIFYSTTNVGIGTIVSPYAIMIIRPDETNTHTNTCATWTRCVLVLISTRDAFAPIQNGYWEEERKKERKNSHTQHRQKGV